MTPARPANAPPNIKVMEITRLGLTPISAAICVCSAVARIALPSFVFSTKNNKPAITTKATTMITISLPVMVAPLPHKSIGLDGNNCG